MTKGGKLHNGGHEGEHTKQNPDLTAKARTKKQQQDRKQKMPINTNQTEANTTSTIAGK